MNFKEFDAELAISAALDSLDLITTLKSKKRLTIEEKATYNRNVDHIKIMMSREEFVQALNAQQIEDFSVAIL